MFGVYICLLLAVLCIVGAIRDWPFPLAHNAFGPPTGHGAEECEQSDASGRSSDAGASGREGNPQRLPMAVDAQPDLTAQKLIRLFKGRTALQGRSLVQPFLGRRMRVQGIVYSVSSHAIGRLSIGFEDPVTTFMYFDGGYEPQLHALQIGDHVTVEGDLFDVTGHSVVLDNCDLIEVQPP